jgi:hypothetical protein
VHRRIASILLFIFFLIYSLSRVLTLVPAAATDDDSPNGTSGGSGATFASLDGPSSADDLFNVPEDQEDKVDGFSPIPVPGDDWSDWFVDLVPQTGAMG